LTFTGEVVEDDGDGGDLEAHRAAGGGGELEAHTNRVVGAPHPPKAAFSAAALREKHAALGCLVNLSSDSACLAALAQCPSVVDVLVHVLRVHGASDGGGRASCLRRHPPLCTPLMTCSPPSSTTLHTLDDLLPPVIHHSAHP